MSSSVSLRWLAVTVFVISSSLNYLDRSLLSTLAPLVMGEFHLNQSGFGWLVAIFSLVYAVSSLLAGWILDRFGLNKGIITAIAWWSSAAVSTGFVGSINGLGACRAALAVGESAGVPAFGKLNGIYLKPEERAIGAAANQIGLSIGAALASVAVGVALTHGWRVPFVAAGLAGFIWIPVWWIVSKLIPPGQSVATVSESAQPVSFRILADHNLLILVVVNLLWMGGYSLWSNWTTLYLIHVQGVPLKETAHYVWIPQLVSNAGGFFGGWLSFRWTKRLGNPVSARRRAIWVSAAGFLVTLVLPSIHSAAYATAVISASFFFALAGSVNIYALPIDLFGAKRAGLAIAALTAAFGLLQTVISPIIGYLSDRGLYTEVVLLVTLPPLAAAALLHRLKSQ